MKWKIVSLAVFMAFVHSLVLAGNFKNITADELKAMLDRNTKMVIVDARPGPEYSQGHIPKSLNIPPEKVGNIGAMLPKNKKTLVAFYCRGAG